MPTRKQNTDSPSFRQGAYASSAEFERGILGNLVALRCQMLADREAISLLWWLQQRSWCEGGLLKLSEAFLAKHRHLIGTPSMHQYGMKDGQIYNAEQVRKVRSELRSKYENGRDLFPLSGEQKLSEVLAAAARSQIAGWERRSEQDTEPHPPSYPMDDFKAVCEVDADELAEQLSRMLIDPKRNPSDGLWNIPDLFPALCAWRNQEASLAAGRIVETEVTRSIFDELDFALETKAFILIEGREGIGKSEAVRNWCDCRPGRAIYVRLESGADETTLYRSIAKRIGTACSYARKTVEMRMRIQDALQPGHLMLVLDESHFLWPMSGRSERAVPKRVDWLRTALVDFGVPVALVSTPQFFSKACDRFRKGGWNSLQIQRRLARTVSLPDDLPPADVVAVAHRSFPKANAKQLKLIAAISLGHVGYLTTIEHMRKRFEFIGKRRPGLSDSQILQDVFRDFGFTAPESSTDQSLVKPALRAPQARFKQPQFTRMGGSRVHENSLETVPIK